MPLKKKKKKKKKGERNEQWKTEPFFIIAVRFNES